MQSSIVRVVTSKPRMRNLLKRFFKSPMNDALLAALIVGIFLLGISGTMHPVASSILSQKNQYPVTSNLTSGPAFTLFSNKITYVKFQMPQKQILNYSLLTLTEEHVTDSLANPGGIKLVWKNVANGTAQDGTVIQLMPQNIPFSLQSQVMLNSLTGGSYNVTIVSYAYYNTTLSFDPAYAISGLAMSIISITVLASIAGMKVEES